MLRYWLVFFRNVVTLGIITLLPILSFAKTKILIFPFFSKKDVKDITYSTGVKKSFLTFAEILPNVEIIESDYNIKDKDYREVVSFHKGFDFYMVAEFDVQGDVTTYMLTLLDREGKEVYRDRISSQDLFEISDNMVRSLSSFLLKQEVGFATIKFDIRLDKEKYSLLINDSIIRDISGNQTISSKVLSKVPYNIVVRKESTKEVVFTKSVVLLENEVLELKINLPTDQNVTTQTSELTKQVKSDYKIIKDIEDAMRRKDIFNDVYFSTLQKDVVLLSFEVRESLYEKHKIGLARQIISSVLNIIPGLGSLVIGDNTSFLISLISPYFTGIVYGSKEIVYGSKELWGVVTLVFYVYNLSTPFIYANSWNSRLENLLLFDKPKKFSLIPSLTVEENNNLCVHYTLTYRW